MLLNDWLQTATKNLESVQISSARLDILILLEDQLKKDRSWILANSDYELTHELLKNLNELVVRRAKHEPLAYIRGKSEFYGRTFRVTSATLQPRPETETMITELKKLKLSREMDIADVGTGSGCLAITAKLELPYTQIYATEINIDALKIAKQNAKEFRALINFYQGDILRLLESQHLDIVLANLPYVPDSHTINEAAMYEPRVAIFGGEDGLDLYRRLFIQISQRKQKPKYALTESLPFQHQVVTQIAQLNGYALTSTEDFIQVFNR